MIAWLLGLFKNKFPKVKFNKELDRYEITLDKDLVINAPNQSIYVFSDTTTIQTNKVLNLNPVPNYDSSELNLLYYHGLVKEHSDYIREEYSTKISDVTIETQELSCVDCEIEEVTKPL